MFTLDSGGGALGLLSWSWAQAPAVIIVTAISIAISLPVFITLTIMTSNLALSKAIVVPNHVLG
jgi:hypothetical protein